jgi:hypothetical protein
VLHGLEAADRLAELPAFLGVVHRQLEGNGGGFLKTAFGGVGPQCGQPLARKLSPQRPQSSCIGRRSDGRFRGPVFLQESPHRLAQQCPVLLGRQSGLCGFDAGLGGGV